MEERKKSYLLLIVSAVLFVISLIVTIYAHGHSYIESTETGAQLSEVRGLLKEIEAGEAAGDVEALKARQAQLSDLKLSQERPYSYGLTALFMSLLLVAKGLYNALVGTVKTQEDIKRLAMAGLMAALCYIGFAVFKIDIPVGPGKTAFHFGNVFCVLAALLLGGFWGGLAGAIGMTIGDLFDPVYVVYAPKTFILKFCIGLITGLIAHKIAHISTETDNKKVYKWSLIAAVGGLLFNVIFDPLFGYFYKLAILGKPAAEVTLAWNVASTSINAVTSTIVAVLVYNAVRPALKKSGLFFTI